MAFGLIRVRNLSLGVETNYAEVHNGREYEKKGLKTPDNIGPDKWANQFGTNEHTLYGGDTLEEAITNRLKTLNIKPRSNSVAALEYVVGLVGSKKEIEEAYKNYSATGFLGSYAKDFLAKRHGHENIVSVSLHFDEGNPHAHIIVVPIVEKEVSWKNKNGSGTRRDSRLCARDFTGHRDKLSQLQTDYFNDIKNLEKTMGIDIYRGIKKEEQLRTYTQKTNHELGELRAKFETAKTIEEAKAIEKEIAAKKAEFEQKQGEMGKIIEKHEQKLSKDDKWKKGMDFGIGF